MRSLNLHEMTLVSGGSDDWTEDDSAVMAATAMVSLGSLGVGSVVGAIFGCAMGGGAAAVVAVNIAMILVAAKHEYFQSLKSRAS
jgi:hypothetical protein